MIADWDTNRLFVSDRLELDEPGFLAALRSALVDVRIETIPGTADIWCRDYMPIQLDEDRFCQFVYAPDYLRGFEHLITPPCHLPFMRNYRQEPIVLDGGNVVASRKKAILTDKVFKENPTIERPRLRKRLEELFQAKCVFIPTEGGDDVGHADGVVRFLAEDRVIVNDYSGVDPGYGNRVRKVLEKNGLEVETLPMFEEKARRRSGDLAPAVGLYINYLRVGDVVVLPGYNRPEDHQAVETSFPCASSRVTLGSVSLLSFVTAIGFLTSASYCFNLSLYRPRHAVQHAAFHGQAATRHLRNDGVSREGSKHVCDCPETLTRCPVPCGHASINETDLDCYVADRCKGVWPNAVDKLNRGRWWAPCGGTRPQMDLICRIKVCDKDGLLFVEAKAHEGELDWGGKPFADDASEGSKKNQENITRQIADANEGLNCLCGPGFNLSITSAAKPKRPITKIGNSVSCSNTRF